MTARTDISQTLETPRLRLRPLAARDEAACIRFFMSERAQYTGGHTNEIQAWKSFTSHLGHWQARGFGLWAVTEKPDDAIIGMVGPYFPASWPETELGWLIFDGHEGKGFAHEAALAARRHAYDALGWTSMVSYISELNTRSVRLAERLGCTRDATAKRPPHAGGNGFVYRHPLPEGRV